MDTIEIISRLSFRSLNAGQYIANCKDLLSLIKNLFTNMYIYILYYNDKLIFF